MKSNLRHITVILLLLLSCNYLNAQNSKIDRQKELIKSIERDIDFLDNQISQTRVKQKNSLGELVLIKNKVANRKRLINELDREIALQDSLITKKSGEIKVLENRLDTLSLYYKRLVTSAYKNRDSRVWFMYIIASSSIEQGYRRWSYLKNYSKSINSQAEKIKEARANVIRERVVLTNLRSNNIRSKNSREIEYEKFKKEESSTQKVVKSLAGKERLYKSQLSKKKSESLKLSKEVERLIAQAIKIEKPKVEPKKDATTYRPVTQLRIDSSVPKLTGTFASNKGKLPRPVKGVVIEQFGVHYHPTLKSLKLPFNNGINISAAKEANVISVFAGEVKQIIAMPGYNKCVLIQHGTYFTFYCKLDKVNVTVGQKIAIGTIIGSLAIKDNTSELHFELWNGTTKQNPQLWLRKN